jgi:hypothetical protein
MIDMSNDIISWGGWEKLLKSQPKGKGEDGFFQ